MTGNQLHPLLVGRQQAEPGDEQRFEVDVATRHPHDDANLIGLLHGRLTRARQHGDQLQQLAGRDVVGQRLDDELEGAFSTGWSPR